MRYERFRIRNFKGIKDASVDLRSIASANVFAFVGLNESGKTTLLEAIHSFLPDYLSRSVIKSQMGNEKELAQSRVPRHKLANFTGDVSVEAVVSLSEGDEQAIRKFAEREYDLVIGPGDFPELLSVRRIHRFSRGDFIGNVFETDFPLEVKKKGRKKFQAVDTETVKLFWGTLVQFLPSIAYYPTFIFDFPERIYLTFRPGAYDSFYQSVFGDVLAYDGQGYTLDDIVRRIRADEMKVPWASFVPAWMVTDSRGKVQQIIDRASKSMTDVVLGKWNQIFGEDARGKEVVVDYGLDEGRRFVKNPNPMKLRRNTTYMFGSRLKTVLDDFV